MEPIFRMEQIGMMDVAVVECTKPGFEQDGTHHQLPAYELYQFGKLIGGVNCTATMAKWLVQLLTDGVIQTDGKKGDM